MSYSWELSPIHLAAFEGDIDKLTKLFMDGNSINLQDRAGETLLFSAVRSNQTETVQWLLEWGANPNIKTFNIEPYALKSYTPLHYAAEENYVECVKILLDYDADIEAPEQNGQTPLLLALDTSNAWARIAAPDAAKLLIARGANVNATFMDKSTLFWARASNHREKSPDKDVIEMLINAGAK